MPDDCFAEETGDPHYADPAQLFTWSRSEAKTASVSRDAQLRG